MSKVTKCFEGSLWSLCKGGIWAHGRYLRDAGERGERADRREERRREGEKGYVGARNEDSP